MTEEEDYKYTCLAEMSFYNEMVGGASYEVSRTRTLARFPKLSIVEVMLKLEGKGSFFESLLATFKKKESIIETVMTTSPNHPRMVEMEIAEHNESSEPGEVLNTALIKKFRAQAR